MTVNRAASLDVYFPGTVSYARGLDIQRKFLQRRQNNEIPDTLLMLQHTPVITVSRRADSGDVLLPAAELESRGIEVHETSRGGEVTYHGPGQVVGYVIMDLSRREENLHEFVRLLEQVSIDFLQDEYGIEASRDPDHTGVWVGNEKITAIGIAVRKKVSMHGFAININNDLDSFSLIVPCGIRDKGVTSLKKLTGMEHQIDEVQLKLVECFCSVFGYEKWIKISNSTE